MNFVRYSMFVPILFAHLLAFAPVHILADEESVQPTDELALNQSDLASRYAELEKLILRMAEFDAADNPRRAELLKKAFGMSKERNVRIQFDKLVDLLKQQKLARAITNQRQVKTDLQTILDLLLTENRADRLKDEQARIKEYIREIERLQRLQRSVQGRTEGGIDPKQAANEQKNVAQETGELRDEIQKNESDARATDSDASEGSEGAASSENLDADSKGNPKENPSDSDRGNSSEGDTEGNPKSSDSDSDAQSDDDKNGEPKDGADRSGGDKETRNGKPNSSAQPTEPQDKPGDGVESPSPSSDSPSSTEPSQGQPSQGQPSQGQPSGDSQSQDSQSQDSNSEQRAESQPSFPGHDRLKQAEEKMRQAEQKLAEAQRESAIRDQEEAAKKLAEAKAELEEILRQRREEEIERVLALLETRFRKMLEMQLQVYENTMRLFKIPAARRDRFVDIESGKLSFQERRIVVEAEKCLALLRDEGSSVAFPESVQQMTEDMQNVERRLGKSQIGRITQGLEEDIIESLDEMIAALQQAQMDQEDRRQQQQQQAQPQPQQDQSLVDQIAELKMLKAMQLRINKRTTRYSRLLDDDQDVAGQATDAELVTALHELSERELRLHGITHDIVVGKNK